jgi:hypothetical protein
MIWEIHTVSALHSLFRNPLLVFSGLILILNGCDGPGDPIVPVPDDVQLVPHTLADDLQAIERGIDAVPDEIEGIYLAWYSLNDRNIKQYNIYRRRDDESYFRLIRTIPIATASPGKDTTYVDNDGNTGLQLNIYYHYFVTASNTQDAESEAVDTLKYMLLNKALLRLPDGQSFSADSLPTLAWDFVEIPNEYILRVENAFGQLIYIGTFQSDYDNDAQTKDLNDIAEFPVLSSGTYTWRIDSIGPDEDNSGAEAVPKTFDIL